MVSGGLKVRDADGVRLLTLAGPPSNRLDPGLRAALVAALTDLPPEVGRVVLAAEGPSFSSALPVDPDPSLPGLAALCHAVETAAVPVVAALHGLVLGPGAELALAARARVAAPGTRIAFAEVVLGLCPEGGSTRRLARRIGTAAALRLLLSGRAVPEGEALALGLVDAVEADPFATASSMTVVAPATDSPRLDAGAVAAARRTQARHLPAPRRIIDCVEAAALLPVEAHQAFEGVAREDLEASPEAAALRWMAKAERRAASLPAALARVRVAAPDRIALHGGGADLVTLARLALAQGLEVVWVHEGPEAAATSLAALNIHASPPVDPSATAVHVVIGEGGAHPGLALAPAAGCCELALPPEGRGPEADALVLALLRRLGLQPILVGLRPILGRGLVTAGRSALTAMAAAGVPVASIAAALEGFGAPSPGRLPEPAAGRTDMAADLILFRWLGALANEGLRLLDQGIARHPSDIDLVLVQGHGFPRWRGGPMHLAERRGLMALRADLRGWADENPLWSPAPLLDRMIRDGQRLSDPDRPG
jgi:3-hydroxyacyl-CoA dehydrogenase